MSAQLGTVENAVIGLRSYSLPAFEGMRFRRMWNAACNGEHVAAHDTAVQLRSARPSTQVLITRLLNDISAKEHAWTALRGELSDDAIVSLGQIARDKNLSGRYAALAILAESTNPKATSELAGAITSHPDDTALGALLHGSKHHKSDFHLSELCRWVCDSERRCPERYRDTFGVVISGCLQEISGCRDPELARDLFGKIVSASLSTPPTAAGQSREIGKCLATLTHRLSASGKEAASVVIVSAASAAGAEPSLRRADQVRVLVSLGTESAFAELTRCASGCRDAACSLDQVIENTFNTLVGRPIRWNEEPVLPSNPALVLRLIETILDSSSGVPSYLAKRAATLAIQMGGTAGLRAVVSRSSLSQSNRADLEVKAGCDHALCAACNHQIFREQIRHIVATLGVVVPHSSNPAEVAYWLTLEKRLTPHSPARNRAGCIPARLYPSPEAFVAAGFSFGGLLPGTLDLVYADLPKGWAFEIYSCGAVILDKERTVRVMIGSRPDSPSSVISCSLLDPYSPGHLACGLEYLAKLKSSERYEDQEDLVFQMDQLPPETAISLLTGKAFAPGRGGHDMSRW